MVSKSSLSCFKAYDIRGELGKEFNEEIAYRIGRATAETLNSNLGVVGFDARLTSNDLSNAVVQGLIDAGTDVLNIGLAGTEEMYFSVSEFGACVGIEVTASHNPKNYNGMKIVKKASQPLTSEEFQSIKLLAEINDFRETTKFGMVTDNAFYSRQAFTKKVLSFVDVQNLKPLKIVVNSGNGAAGPTVDSICERLAKLGVKHNLTLMDHIPDPSFPNGIPNPLIKENQIRTSKAVKRENAEFGVAFDGDFDRCFFFDSNGDFVSGEYIIGLLAEAFLKREPGARIVHDNRIIWSILESVKKHGGFPTSSATGHALMKKEMRKAKAVYGGEMSAHHYFRDFNYCDSGMIPWLLVWELLSKSDKNLYELVKDRKLNFISSGEINFKVKNPTNCISKLKKKYSQPGGQVELNDGLSVEFKNWRFNVRKSNTEPLVRLNLESKGDRNLLNDKTNELSKFIETTDN